MTLHESSATLVLKYYLSQYHSMGIRGPGPSFNFSARHEIGDDMELGGATMPLGVYVIGPVGKKSRFLVIKDGFNQNPGEVVETADSQKEAILIAYEEALKLKRVIFDHLNFLYKNKYLDETPFVKQSKLEASVQA